MATDIEVPENMHIENEPPATDPTDTTPNPRKDAMQDIYASRAKQIEEENQAAAKQILNIAPEEPLPEPTPDPAPVEPPAAPEKPPVSEPPAEPPITDPNPGAAEQKKYSLAINGRTIEMNEDEVLRAAQKVLSADEKFQQAAQLRNEAVSMQQRQPVQQPVYSAPAPHQPQGYDPAQIIDDATADELVKKINFGSEQEQRTAIRDLGAAIATGMGRANTGPTPDQVVEVATQRALATIHFQSNMAAIANEFSDVFQSRPLSIAAADTVGQLRMEYAAKGLQKSDIDLYREACTSIRDQFVKPREEQAPAPQPLNVVQAAQPAVTGEKFERKRAAPKPPAAATMVATETSKPKGYDPSTIVQQMRKQRGQQAF